MKSKTKVRTISPYNDHSDNYFLVIFYEISLVILSEEQITSINISNEQKRSDDEVKKGFYNWTEQKTFPDFNLKPVRRLQQKNESQYFGLPAFFSGCVFPMRECEIGFFSLFCAFALWSVKQT